MNRNKIPSTHFGFDTEKNLQSVILPVHRLTKTTKDQISAPEYYRRPLLMSQLFAANFARVNIAH